MTLRENDLKIVVIPLVSFSSEVIKPLGIIAMPILFVDKPRCKNITVDHLVDKVQSSHWNSLLYPSDNEILHSIKSWKNQKRSIHGTLILMLPYTNEKTNRSPQHVTSSSPKKRIMIGIMRGKSLQ